MPSQSALLVFRPAECYFSEVFYGYNMIAISVMGEAHKEVKFLLALLEASLKCSN